MGEARGDGESSHRRTSYVAEKRPLSVQEICCGVAMARYRHIGWKMLQTNESHNLSFDEERACVDHKITSYECIVNSCFITATIGQPSQAAMWSISRVRSIELGMAVRCRFLCMRDCTKICLVMCLLSSQWGSCVRAYSTKRNSMFYLLWFVPPTSGTKWFRHSLPWISVPTLRCLLLL